MQEISQFFKQYKEELPYWLKNYKEGMDVAFDTVMGGRVGYYPGSGFDGNLVAVANKAPWLFLLQDHGFGCNYDRFGKNGFLDAIIRESNILPEYVICATDTHIWDGYSRVEGTKETHGGMHQHERFLYKRD